LLFRCRAQGFFFRCAPSRTSISNDVLSCAGSMFPRLGAAQGWGVEVPDADNMGLLPFADNFRLISGSHWELSKMTDVWWVILAKLTWRAPKEDRCWRVAFEDDKNLRIARSGVEIPRVKRGVGLKSSALECWSHWATIASWIYSAASRAWGAFCKLN
jgi:hypothetical protein